MVIFEPKTTQIWLQYEFSIPNRPFLPNYMKSSEFQWISIAQNVNFDQKCYFQRLKQAEILWFLGQKWQILSWNLWLIIKFLDHMVYFCKMTFSAIETSWNSIKFESKWSILDQKSSWEIEFHYKMVYFDRKCNFSKIFFWNFRPFWGKNFNSEISRKSCSVKWYILIEIVIFRNSQ